MKELYQDFPTLEEIAATRKKLRETGNDTDDHHEQDEHSLSWAEVMGEKC